MKTQTTPRLCLFGIPGIEVGAVRIDRFPTKRCVQILAHLAMARQWRLSRYQLAELLWPDEVYEVTRLRLRQELTRLRHTLGDSKGILQTFEETVGLDSNGLELDVGEFERLVEHAAQTQDLEQRQLLLRQAITIASSPFMSDASEGWIEIERMRLDVSRYEAMVSLSSLLLDARQPAEALVISRDAIQIAPEREGANLIAVQALNDLGHRESAMARFQAFRKMATTERGGRLSANAEQIGASLLVRSDGWSETQFGLTFSAPAPSEPIFGREDELASIAERLDPNRGNVRLLSVLGMGGIGKTHLIHYACRDLAASFGNRIGFIDLSNLEDPALIPVAILRSLGLGYVPTNDPIGYLKRALPEEPHLLALDNLEQFGGLAAPTLRRLLDEIPTMHILAGARTAQNLAGEHRLNLTPLTLPIESAGKEEAEASPAFRLFMSVAGADQSLESVRQEDWPTLSNIVRRLEGVPLGLQLAASRMRTLGPAALLRDLDQGLDTLVSRRADAPERHQSMRNAVESSFDLLSPYLQNAISGLAIFRGGWSLEAARLVCDLQDPAGTMEQLADASLISIVNAGGQVRFRMLETIREYSRALLDEGRAQELRSRFVAWMVEKSGSVAFEIVDQEVKQAIDQLEVERDNVREALRFSLDESPGSAFELGAKLASYWRFRTSGFEAHKFYTELFRRYPSFPESSTVLRASFGHSQMAHFVSAPEGSEIYDRTLQMGRRLQNRSFEPKVLVFHAYRFQNTIRYDECRACLEEIDRFTAEFGSFESEAFVSRIKGIFAQYQGDPEHAISHFREAAGWLNARGEIFYVARARMDLASAAIDLSNADLAEANLAGLLEIANETRFLSLVPYIHGLLGLVALLRRDFETALRKLNESLIRWKEIAGGFDEGDQWNAIGRTYFEMGNMADSRVAFTKAGELWLQDGLPVAVAVAVSGLAAVCFEERDFGRAASFFEAADREIIRAGARLKRFHSRFIDRIRANLAEVSAHDQMQAASLTIEEAVRLGASASVAYQQE